MILRCDAIFWRAAASILVSSINSFFESLAGLLTDSIAILQKIYLLDLSQGVGYGVGELVELVARNPHSTALYLRASSNFTFLNISG